LIGVCARRPPPIFVIRFENAIGVEPIPVVNKREVEVVPDGVVISDCPLVDSSGVWRKVFSKAEQRRKTNPVGQACSRVEQWQHTEASARVSYEAAAIGRSKATPGIATDTRLVVGLRWPAQQRFKRLVDGRLSRWPLATPTSHPRPSSLSRKDCQQRPTCTSIKIGSLRRSPSCV
jgi:hypothetical protein